MQKFQEKIGVALEHMLELGDISMGELWLDFKDTTNEITETYRDKERLVKKAKRTIHETTT